MGNIVDRGGTLEMFALHEDALSDVENVLHCKVEMVFIAGYRNDSYTSKISRDYISKRF